MERGMMRNTPPSPVEPDADEGSFKCPSCGADCKVVAANPAPPAPSSEPASESSMLDGIAAGKKY